MKRTTVERRRGKIGNFAQRKSEQLRGIFRSTSPLQYCDGDGMGFENFKKHKRGTGRS